MLTFIAFLPLKLLMAILEICGKYILGSTMYLKKKMVIVVETQSFGHAGQVFCH